MTFTKIALTLTFVLSTFAEHAKPERLAMPLEDGESHTYDIMQALGSRETEGATLELTHNKITISHGECSFGGEYVYDKNNMAISFVPGTFFNNFSMCKSPIVDVQMMIQDLEDSSKGYAIREKIFNADWFLFGWNAPSENEVDLLVARRQLGNPHSLEGK